MNVAEDLCTCDHVYGDHSWIQNDLGVASMQCDRASCRCTSFEAASLITDDAKDTNPKDAVGIRKAPFSTVPAPVQLELGLAMMEGALKYGRHNYRVSGVRASVYYDAVVRHLMAWWEGEDHDPEVKGAKISHLVKAMACLAVVRDAERLGKLVDDRPPSHEPGWVAELNKQAAAMLEAYPNPKPTHTKEG